MDESDDPSRRVSKSRDWGRGPIAAAMKLFATMIGLARLDERVWVEEPAGLAVFRAGFQMRCDAIQDQVRVPSARQHSIWNLAEAGGGVVGFGLVRFDLI